MTLIPQPDFAPRHRYRPLLDRLAILFGEMDRAYSDVADRYGFQCNGCVDNCCLTRFHHYTLLEYLYLLEGVSAFDPDLRRSILKRAQTVSARMDDADQRGESLRIMCPLNQDGQCMAYDRRPMICRLHGIPHELHRPGGPVIKNPGCAAFFDQCRDSGATAYIRFDRTPFYRQMAMLEKELRRETGYTHKVKFTIAQMLGTLIDKAYEID
jgi:Fe-S-cluster containining protein